MLFCKSHLMSQYPYGAFSLAMSLPRKKNRKSQFATIKKTEPENKVWIQFHTGSLNTIPSLQVAFLFYKHNSKYSRLL